MNYKLKPVCTALFLFSTGCSLEGDWVGSCSSDDGTRIDFEVDFDEVTRTSIAGDAELDFYYADGSGEGADCEIGGSKKSNKLELYFNCLDVPDFFIDLFKNGKVLVGDCGDGAELILKRQEPVEVPEE